MTDSPATERPAADLAEPAPERPFADRPDPRPDRFGVVAPRDVRSLSDRLSEPIEDASIGVTAILSKIIRQSIRSGVTKLEEGLGDAVNDRLEEEIRVKGPELAHAAKTAAREEMGDQIDKLWSAAKESGARINAQLARLDEAIKLERDARQVLQNEGNELARQLRNEAGHLRDEIAGQLKQNRHDLTDLVGQGREAALAALSTSRGEVDRNVGDLAQRLTQAQERAAAELLQARGDLFKRVEQDSNDLLRRLEQATADGQRKLEAAVNDLIRQLRNLQQVAEQQKHALSEQTKAITELAAEQRQHAGRLATIEEKVFRPGFFGRLGGMFRGKPKGELPSG